MKYSQFLSLWRKSGSEAAATTAKEQGVEQRLVDMWTRYILRKYR